MVRLFRKPLVIFTPKSLLRHKGAVSDLSELARGQFETVISEVDKSIKPKDVKRIVACSGRVYYDLIAAREEKKHDDVAIIRLEQMYPFPHKAFAAEIKKFAGAAEVVWCQDEPQNQGPWFQIQHNILENMNQGQSLAYAGRPPSASPAVGYMAKHIERQKALVAAAFGKAKGSVLTK